MEQIADYGWKITYEFKKQYKPIEKLFKVGDFYQVEYYISGYNKYALKALNAYTEAWIRTKEMYDVWSK